MPAILIACRSNRAPILSRPWALLQPSTPRRRVRRTMPALRAASLALGVDARLPERRVGRTPCAESGNALPRLCETLRRNFSGVSGNHFPRQWVAHRPIAPVAGPQLGTVREREPVQHARNVFVGDALPLETSRFPRCMEAPPADRMQHSVRIAGSGCAPDAACLGQIQD